MKKIIPIIIILCIILCAIIYVKSSGEKTKEENLSATNTLTEKEIIEQIKNETYATADTNMYQVQEEYDGRKIIQIKPDIEFDTVLSGILENGKPNEKEIKEILKNRPNKSGIWISKQSRQKFSKLLKNNNLSGYFIDEQGYLTQKNGNNKNLNKAINSEKQYIIDIAGTCYTRDEISGEIVEYPFEEMDPNQITETYNLENSTIILVTNNKKGKISDKKILNEIIENLEVE